MKVESMPKALKAFIMHYDPCHNDPKQIYICTRYSDLGVRMPKGSMQCDWFKIHFILNKSTLKWTKNENWKIHYQIYTLINYNIILLIPDLFVATSLLKSMETFLPKLSKVFKIGIYYSFHAHYWFWLI